MIGIYNDHKEKWQSFEAYVKNNDAAVGYGADQEEAIENLKKSVAEQIAELKIKIHNLENLDYTKTTELVDYKEKSFFTAEY